MFVLAVIGVILVMVLLYVDPPSRGPEAQRRFEEQWAPWPMIPGLLGGLPLLLVLLGVGMDAILAVLLAVGFWLLVTASWIWRGRA